MAMENTIRVTYRYLRGPLLLLLSLACLRFGVIPGWKQVNSDFPNYYVSAQLLQKGILHEAYDIEKFNSHIHEINSNADGMFVMYPPTTALIMQAFTGVNMLTAKRIWVVLTVGMLVLIIILFAKITNIAVIDAANLLLLCGFNLFNDIMLGQVYTMMLLLLVVAHLAWIRQSWITAGICWGVVAALKFLPLFFLPLLLYKKQFRLVGYMIITFFFMHLITYLVGGVEVYRPFFAAFIQNYVRGEVAGEIPLSIQYQSMQVIVNRLMLQGNITAPIGTIITLLWKLTWLLIAVYLCFRVRNQKYFIEVAYSSMILLLLLFENGSATYHLLFTVPIWFTVYKLHISEAGKGFMLLAFICMGFIPFLVHVAQLHTFITDYSRLWCICLFAACYFYLVIRDHKGGGGWHSSFTINGGQGILKQ
jgi:hypothetical protein